MIEIVTSCWSGDDVPVYHRLLQCQLSSLLNINTTNVHVKISIFFNPDDLRTVGVLEHFLPKLQRLYDGTSVSATPLEPAKLFRRAISRNIAALRTRAQAVWFTDCDYCFTGEALEAAHLHCVRSTCDMVFPRSVNIHRDHRLGDQLISSIRDGDVWELNPSDFIERREKRGYGGLQIVKGEHCRKHGYLDGTEWVKPVDPAGGFRSCRGDVPFRKSVTSEPADIPGVYRLRHSRAGRDRGTVDHYEKTFG